ncbi:MAG: cytochrome c biogenesis protein ResB [Candidatus Sericytochromatia bacterium]|nr:cytochrome c biogenesis protein ResB [Candidatus Tanganyikabacteria bacterium]
MPTETEVAAEISGPAAYDRIRTSFVRFWSSVKLAVVLILAIAIASTIGTIVPQGEPSGVTNIEGMSERTKQILLSIKAYNVYYSPWFLSLLALFFLNLAVCTYVRVWPRLQFALTRPREIPVAARDHMPEQQDLSGAAVEDVATELRRARFRVFPASDGGLVADKNRVFRFAPMVVHLGLFLILAGGITAGLMGFKNSFPLVPGEAMGVEQAMKEAKTRGLLTPKPADFKVRLDKFWMTHYDDGRVKQFYSTLSVLRGDKVAHTQTIHVNEPLEYEGVYFYQSFWGIAAQKLSVARGIKSEIPMNNQGGTSIKLSGWVTSRLALGGRELFAYTSGISRPWYLLDMQSLKSLGELHTDEDLAVAGHKLRLGEVKTLPGLGSVKLRIGGETRTVPVESANRFKLSGYISRQLKVGEFKVFLYVESPDAELQVIDLDSFASLAKVPLGASAKVEGVDIAFLDRGHSAETGGLAAVDLIQDGERIGLRVIDLASTGFRVQAPSTETTEVGGRAVIMMQNTEPPGMPLWIIDAHDATALAILNPGESQKIGHSTVRWDGPIYFSGLQTKSDPGIPVIYAGFFIVILGTLMGMFSHQQVWVTIDANGCRLAGKAARGRYLFHQDMTRLRQRVLDASSKGNKQWAQTPLSSTHRA